MFLRQLLYGSVCSPLVLAISLAAFCAASANLVRFAGAAGALGIAASLERGATLEPGYLNRFISERPLAALSAVCADAATRARLTLAAAALRDADASQDTTAVGG